MLSEDKNFFRKLNEINVNEHTEQKNGLTYLSWMWAWQQLKLNYPESYSTIYKSNDGCNYWNDGRTAWVETGVTLVYYDDEGQRRELENIEMLPIMDFKNKSIPLDNITSMDVNKAIQRSITKAIARHGLGAYIYAGEDLPEESDETRANKLETEAKAKKENVSLIKQIDAKVKLLGKNMSDADKRNFANEVIIPIIGFANYRSCQDNIKLKALLKTLQDTKGD